MERAFREPRVELHADARKILAELPHRVPVAPFARLFLRDLVAELGATSELLDRQRPLRRPTALGGEARDEQTLIEHLCTIDGLSGDLALPLKATLSRTYLLTKINFLRGFVKATAPLGDAPACKRMTHELREEVAQSIYTLLAEELFLALLRKPDVTRRTKQRAADQLITIWDDAALEIDDFAPLLESAWHARNRINAAYGTLLGATAHQAQREGDQPRARGAGRRDRGSARTRHQGRKEFAHQRLRSPRHALSPRY